MSSFLIFLIFYVSFILPLHESMLTYSQRMRILAEIDEKIGQEADLVSDSLNKALSLNQKLQILYGQCSAAQTPPQIAALRLEGEVIEFEQNVLLLGTKLRLLQLQKDFLTEIHLPFRPLQGPCELPGLLKCFQKNIFEIRRNKKSENGGARGLSRQCQEIRWQFQDQRVKEL